MLPSNKLELELQVELQKIGKHGPLNTRVSTVQVRHSISANRTLRINPRFYALQPSGVYRSGMNTCTLEAVATISERAGSANQRLEQLQRRQQPDSTYRLLEARFAARGFALSQNP